MTGPRYQEIAPQPALAPFVECFWTSRSETPLPATAQSRVLPDGCADVIFDFSEHPVGPASPAGGERSYVVGAMTAALVVEHFGRVDLLGVRFRPGGAAAFLHLPLGELTDRRIDAQSLGDGWQATTTRILSAESVSERIALLEAALSIRLRSAAMTDRLVARAWSRLVETAGALPVRQLANEVGLGERRLQRLFHERVGLSPKEAARIARFRATLEHMRSHPHEPLVRIALEGGYYDQPHFTREFSRLAGLPPEAWRRERAQADHSG